MRNLLVLPSIALTVLVGLTSGATADNYVCNKCGTDSFVGCMSHDECQGPTNCTTLIKCSPHSMNSPRRPATFAQACRRPITLN
jgi:hypothetical protein